MCRRESVGVGVKRGWDPELEREVFDTLSILAGGKIGVNPYTVRFVDLGIGRE